MSYLFITGDGEREVGVRGSINLSPFGLAGTWRWNVSILSIHSIDRRWEIYSIHRGNVDEYDDFSLFFSGRNELLTAGFSFFLSAGIGCTSTVGFVAGITGRITVGGMDTVGRSIEGEARLSIDGDGEWDEDEEDEKEDSSRIEGDPIRSRWDIDEENGTCILKWSNWRETCWWKWAVWETKTSSKALSSRKIFCEKGWRLESPIHKCHLS